MTVHEPQTDAPKDVPDAGERPQEQRAVAPEHERALSARQRRGHGLAQGLGGHA